VNEEYEDALVLAQQYGLNCDLVYQRQWHSYPVTVETIEAYLVCVLYAYTCTSLSTVVVNVSVCTPLQSYKLLYRIYMCTAYAP
jgi:hypothetical protein